MSLLSSNPHKYVVFAHDGSINAEIMAMIEQQEANIWLASDINLLHDADDWQKLSADESFYLKKILAFFASSDGIVGENLALNFIQEVQIPEVRYFYYFQCMFEAVHSKIYTQMITTFINSDAEREELFDSIHIDPIIKAKAEWAFKYMNPKTASFSERLIAFLAVEGIFFAGSFAAIFWIRDRGILANSLGVANEYIMRDETLHADFASALYRTYCNDLPEDKIREILLSALELEIQFTKQILPDRLFGMNQDLMIQYLEYVVDTWLDSLKLKKEFNTPQPFSFMASIGERRKDNFFEKSRTNYARKTSTSVLDFEALDGV